MDVNYGKLMHPNQYGYLWSSSATTVQNRAFDFYIEEIVVHPSYSDAYAIGFPLRCLAE